MEIVVLYHFPCLDGLCAGWAAWLEHPDATFIPFDPCRPTIPEPPRPSIIYYLDCAPTKAVFDALSLIHDVRVLDHHEGNFHTEDCDPTQAGCVLAFKHFHPGLVVPDLLVRVGERDLGAIHKHRYLGRALFARAPKTFEDIGELLHSVDELEAEGRELEAEVDEAQRTLRLAPACHNGIEFRYGFVDTHKHMSELAQRILKPGEIVCFCQQQADGVKLSFRSLDQDVLVLAKSLGGGGHPRAAGALVTEIPRTWGYTLK